MQTRFVLQTCLKAKREKVLRNFHWQASQVLRFLLKRRRSLSFRLHTSSLTTWGTWMKAKYVNPPLPTFTSIIRLKWLRNRTLSAPADQHYIPRKKKLQYDSCTLCFLQLLVYYISYLKSLMSPSTDVGPTFLFSAAQFAQTERGHSRLSSRFRGLLSWKVFRLNRKFIMKKSNSTWKEMNYQTLHIYHFRW